jgi:purine-binding chemotaxis protein CheW
VNQLKANPNYPTASVENSTVKLLVFEIGKLTLALPILQVRKVIKYQDVHGSGLSHVNLIHFDRQQVVVVDLHQKLFKVSLHQTSSDRGYFIVSTNATGELLGIAVSQPPTIMDIATERIRAIPEAYRRADTLGIASHVAVIVRSEIPLTIFILDRERLI